MARTRVGDRADLSGGTERLAPVLALINSGVYVASFYVSAAFAGYLFSALVGAAGWGGAAVWQLTVLPLVGVVALLFVDVRRFSNAALRSGPAARTGSA